MRTRGTKPVDKHVGARVRMRRMMLGMSQETLGDALGVTFQQVQKYEKGTNRIGASRLQDIANFLKVPVTFFFEDQEPPVPENIPANATLSNLEVKLVLGFREIKTHEKRQECLEHVRLFAKH